MEIQNFGVAEDPRTIEEKAEDFNHEELAGAIALNWKEKPKADWKKYSIRNQDGSLSCVAQSAAKALEVKTGIVESAHPIYRSRANFPTGGMWLQDMGNIVKKIGTTTEEADQSQDVGETFMNLPIKIPSTVKASLYVQTNNAIDHIAEAIEIAGACPSIFYGFIDEWTELPVFNGKTVGTDLSHCICGVDYFILNGQKCVLFEDSAHFNRLTYHIMTENYLLKRSAGGIYFLDIAPIMADKPKYTFNKFLTYGMMKDVDVKALQKILAYEGLFPKDLYTGNYYQITAKAVYKWQLKWNVAGLKELDSLMGSRCGPKTIAMLNKMYG